MSLGILFCASIGANLNVFSLSKTLEVNPFSFGTKKCCSILKTGALLQALKEGNYDAAFGGARREEEKSRAKERVFSFRDKFGQWNPKKQRPELWNLYNARIDKGESIRVFPLSNWTELDVWQYINLEKIPVVPMYFAKERKMVERDGQLIPADAPFLKASADKVKKVMCRYRSLGCMPCTGAVRSNAKTVEDIIEETIVARVSERSTRVIDHDQEASMELKKREGYF